MAVGLDSAVGLGPVMNNPPPQIFGPNALLNPEPFTVNDFLPDDYNGYPYDDSGFDDGGDIDGNDPKRRRIARACDSCRKKKIRCDFIPGKTIRCSHCETGKTECIFTQVEKKRQAPKGARYIESLENRLLRMESLLRTAGFLPEDDGGRTDLATLEERLAHGVDRRKSTLTGSAEILSTVTPRENSPLVGRGATPHSLRASTPKTPATVHDILKQKSPEKDSEVSAEQMCSLVTNDVGETRYIGSSSGFSIFSPNGISWVCEKTGDDSFPRLIQSTQAQEREWYQWKPEVFGDIFSRVTFQPLPLKDTAVALMKGYFDNFNCMFPLFHEPTFMHLLERQYSTNPYTGSGWWASLNVALAIAHRMRVMSNVVSQEEDQLAWLYLKNAFAVQAELTLRNNDLLSVQALLGMALFMQGTPNPQPSFFFVSAAIRLSHSIGLHKRGSDFKMSVVENEQRIRVFWIAYMLDKDMALKSGRPPIQDDDDMNVELPSKDPPDNIGNVPASTPSGKFNLFRLMAEFALIQSSVYRNLYTVKAASQSDGELLHVIGKLDTNLQEWKDTIPLEYRPEYEIKAEHTPLVLHVVCLHLAYHNCLTTIHRMAVHHGFWSSRLSDFAIAGLNSKPLNPRIFTSSAICVESARTSISLVKYIPQGDHSCVWLVLYYPVAALVTLFANILQNPQDPKARADTRLMTSVSEFLTTICVEESHGLVRRMLTICMEFERISRMVVERAEREIRGRAKRAHREEASLSTKSIEQQQIEAQARYRRPVASISVGRAASIAKSMDLSPSSTHSVPSPTGYTDPSMTLPTLNTKLHHGRSLSSQSHSPLNDVQFSAPPSASFTSPMQNSTMVPIIPWSDQPQLQTNLGFNSNLFPQTTSSLPQSSSNIPQPVNNLQNMSQPRQDFIPINQDLWQMPMNWEGWEWNDLGMFGPDMNMGLGSANVFNF